MYRQTARFSSDFESKSNYNNETDTDADPNHYQKMPERMEMIAATLDLHAGHKVGNSLRDERHYSILKVTV